jgi:hypothetical protein
MTVESNAVPAAGQAGAAAWRSGGDKWTEKHPESEGDQDSDPDVWDLERRCDPTITEQLADRLLRIDDVESARLASKLLLCDRRSRARDGWRCGLQVCPRCAARAAKRRQRTVLGELESLPAGARVRLVTLSVLAGSIAEGHAALFGAFRELRRREGWRRCVRRGWAQGEYAPTRDGAWNVHLHALVVLRVRRLLPSSKEKLGRAWRDLAAPLPAWCHWSAPREGRAGEGGTFCSRRVLRDQAPAGRVARVGRRAAARRRPGGAAPALAAPVRALISPGETRPGSCRNRQSP